MTRKENPLEELEKAYAQWESFCHQYIHKEEALEVTMQSIRSVLTPETADSEYVIRSKINELQKERKVLLTKALAENDDGKYDFQFTRIKQELEGLQAQLEGCRQCKRPRQWTRLGWPRLPPCWRNSRKATSPLTTS